jgi:hypothetical protein
MPWRLQRFDPVPSLSTRFCDRSTWMPPRRTDETGWCWCRRARRYSRRRLRRGTRRRRSSRELVIELRPAQDVHLAAEGVAADVIVARIEIRCRAGFQIRQHTAPGVGYSRCAHARRCRTPPCRCRRSAAPRSSCRSCCCTSVDMDDVVVRTVGQHMHARQLVDSAETVRHLARGQITEKASRQIGHDPGRRGLVIARTQS